MKTKAQRCSGPVILGEYLRGLLSPEAEQSLVVHLNECEECQQALVMLGAGSTKLLRTARHVGAEGSLAEFKLPAILDPSKTPDQSASTEPWAIEDVLSQLDPPLQDGDLGCLDHYVIQDIIGRGGMGLVLKVFDQRLQRVVAIKVLAPSLSNKAAARERFLREARAVAALRDDHVVSIYAVEENARLPYIVMEHISGGSLLDRLNQAGPLDLKETLRIGIQISLGLAAAHARGLIHRDVKPANVLLDSGLERAKLTDFGLACAVEDAGPASTGVIAGTLHYMAPEQARGEAVDHRADLFSLGSLLYTLCTGDEPFHAGDTMDLLHLAQTHTPRPVRELNPRVPEWLDELIARLQAPNRDDRPASATEVADVLSRQLELLNQPTPTPNESDSTNYRVRRWPMWAGALVLLAGGPIWFVSGLALQPNEASSPVSKPEVSPPPAGTWPPRVLMVLPTRDFFYSDYSTVRSQLQNAGVTCVVAAQTLDVVRPFGTAPGHVPVKPDMRLADAQAANYSAIYFGGGRGMEEYFENGPQAPEARRLIREAITARRLVVALGTGSQVLADADVLKGVRATCYQYGEPRGFYVASLRRSGAIYVDAPVVHDGLIITGRNPDDTVAFTRELRQQLGVP